MILRKRMLISHWRDTGLSFSVVREADGTYVTIGKLFPGEQQANKERDKK